MSRSVSLSFSARFILIFVFFFTLIIFLYQEIAEIRDHVLAIKRNTEYLAHSAKPPQRPPPLPIEEKSQNVHPWLSILIPTVPRKKDPEYLIKTLEILETQLEGFGSTVEVVSWNSNIGGFTVNNIFDQARKRWKDDLRFVFEQNPQPAIKFSRAQLAAGTANKPGVIVQKQARDVAGLLSFAAGRSDFALLIEDDWRFCEDALILLKYAIRKALRRDKDFISLVVSHGMNGIVFRNKDLTYFSDYLLQHQKRRPCDHLVIEWMAGETNESSKYKGNRAHFTFRYNLLEHFGVVSSVGHPWGNSPRCFEQLEMLFKVQAFDSKSCPKDDLWPCSGYSSVGFFSIQGKS